jgi:hypothetical protein
VLGKTTSFDPGIFSCMPGIGGGNLDAWQPVRVVRGPKMAIDDKVAVLPPHRPGDRPCVLARCTRIKIGIGMIVGCMGKRPGLVERRTFGGYPGRTGSRSFTLRHHATKASTGMETNRRRRASFSLRKFSGPRNIEYCIPWRISTALAEVRDNLVEDA